MEPFDAFTSDRVRTVLVPERWRSSPALESYSLIGEIERAVGRFDDESDKVVDALLAMPLDDPLVTPVLLSGVRRLIFLCRGRDRTLLNDLVTEAAIAIGELRRVRPAKARRRLAYVIVDRARDRQRATLRRQLAVRSIDPLTVAESVPSCAPTVEEVVLDRLTIELLHEQVTASQDESLLRSRDSLIELVDEPRLTQAERDRWKYIRRRLVGHLDPDAA